MTAPCARIRLLLPLSLFLLLAWVPLRVQAASGLPEPKDGYYVNDFAGVIGEKTELDLLHTGVLLHRLYGERLVLVTVPDTGELSAEEYARSLFDSWHVGAEDGNGTLLLVSAGDGAYAAVRGPAAEARLGDARLSAILGTALIPNLAEGKANRAAASAYYALAQALDGVPGPAPGQALPPGDSSRYTADNAGVLDAAASRFINRTSARYRTSTGSGLYVATVNNGGGNTLPAYARKKLAGVGAGGDDVLLALDIAADDYYLLQGESAAGVLTNAAAGAVLDGRLEPLFAKGRYEAGAVQTFLGVYSYLLERADGAGGVTNAQAAASQAAPVQAGEPAVRSGAAAVGLAGGQARTFGEESEAAGGGTVRAALVVLCPLLVLLAGQSWRTVKRRTREQRRSRSNRPVPAAGWNRRK
ncbi:TPM domain-containing protein [Paenibacillus glufosinatiresistens]|uniref:TPM domain-containing protein n=1 Tax=Paenibacillus glufosinatiresistens TaxID=3070657 RepID=UPI00286DEFD9|nr:TPM domain-containing protein [Paenibacillus sp. YX.27]